MKKLLDYQLYDQNVYTSSFNGYTTKRLKYNLNESTPTLIGISLKHIDKPFSKFYRNNNLFSVYCRNCDNFFLAPYLSQVYKKENISCPCCGYSHSYKHYRIREKENIQIPYSIHIMLYELKENIKLKLEYKAADMNNIFEDFNEVKVTEEFIFNIKNNTVTWNKQIKPIKQYYKEATQEPINESYEIGYIEDFDFLKEKTAMSYVFFNDSDKNNQKISALFNILREKINQKMKEKGFPKRNLYYNKGTNYKAFMNLLTIANRFRFWDGFPINISENQTTKEWSLQYKIENNFDHQIESKMQNKKSYIQALTEIYNIPNNKIVRSNLTLENLYIIKDIYKAIPNKIVAGNYIEPILTYHKETNTPKNSYEPQIPNPYTYKSFIEMYTTFIPYYKLTPTMISAELKRHQKDTLYLWKGLDKKSKEEFKANIPPFSKLHDKLSVLLTKQKDREVIFDIPKEIFERMNLYLKNSKATVLEKYSQLKKVGFQLNNCAASYVNRINNNLQLVLVSDDQGKPQVLLEINKGSIVQAKTFNNQPVKKNQILNDTVLEFAEKTNLDIKTIDIETRNNPNQIKISA